MNKTLTVSDIAKHLKQDPEAFAANLLGEAPTLRSGTSVRFFEDQSLVVNTGGPNEGRFYSFKDPDAKGDMLDMIHWWRGLSRDKAGMSEAVEIAKQYLSVSDGSLENIALPQPKSAEDRRREQDEDKARRIRTANWIWSMGSDTDGRDTGLAYLRARGITQEVPSDTLKFRRIPREELITKMGVDPDTAPDSGATSLIFAARDDSGTITAVQQVFTTDADAPQGKKAPFKNPKRTNGYMPGASVTLGAPEDHDTMVLVEGPETALSIHQATALPTKITLGSSNFTRAAVPDHVTTLIVAADMEPSGHGLASALKAAQFWKNHGVARAGIAVPNTNDGDYNDIHRKKGDEAVRKSVTRPWFPPPRDQDGSVLVTADARSAFRVWTKTGLEVNARVPGKGRDGNYQPLPVETMVEPHHNRVLMVHSPGVDMRTDHLKRMRPDVEIVTLHDNSKAFRALARNKGDLVNLINSTDMYAPEGTGTVEPVFFSLRRADADALDAPGTKSVAVRDRAISRVDFSFMKDREAIVAPLGKGIGADRRLTEALEAAGADVTRLTWQIFRADESMPRIIRNDIPDGFGAKDAAQEGWTGAALKDLVEISRVNARQIQAAASRGPADPATQTPPHSGTPTAAGRRELADDAR